MKLHANARTCPKSRRLLVERIEAGWSVMEAASAAGITDRTARGAGCVAGGMRAPPAWWIAAQRQSESRTRRRLRASHRSCGCGGCE